MYSDAMHRRLHEEIIDFCAFISPSTAEHNTRLQVIERVTDVVAALWPNAEVSLPTHASFKS